MQLQTMGRQQATSPHHNDASSWYPARLGEVSAMAMLLVCSQGLSGLYIIDTRLRWRVPSTGRQCEPVSFIIPAQGINNQNQESANAVNWAAQ